MYNNTHPTTLILINPNFYITFRRKRVQASFAIHLIWQQVLCNCGGRTCADSEIQAGSIQHR